MPRARDRDSDSKPGRPAPHSPEVRAAALAALMAGQSVSSVAAEYRLPKGTVSAWKNRQPDDGVASDATQKGETPRASVGSLLVTLLEMNLRGLIAVAAVMQVPSWVQEQGAAELGTFVGILHDKTIRMLEAMDRAASPVPPTDTESPV